MSVSREVVEEQLRGLGHTHGFFTAKELHYLPDILAEGETLRAVTSGFYEARTWIIAITNLRLVFLDKGFLYGLRQLNMPLAQISSISQKCGFVFGEIEVATSSGSKTITNIPKKQVLKISAVLAELIHGDGEPSRAKAPSTADTAPASTPAPASAKTDRYTPLLFQEDLPTQLERLERLWKKSVLTDEEFRLAKSKIIGA